MPKLFDFLLGQDLVDNGVLLEVDYAVYQLVVLLSQIAVVVFQLGNQDFVVAVS